MYNDQFYNSFITREESASSEEGREFEGDLRPSDQGPDRSKDLTKADFDRINEENDNLMREIVGHMKEGPRSRSAQKLITQHYNNLKNFYEPTPALYRGLANLYIQDIRFSKYFENFDPDLARFMHDAMIAFCETHEAHA